jgi:DEAD/DEAH box helicase domain-containing protein
MPLTRPDDFIATLRRNPDFSERLVATRKVAGHDGSYLEPDEAIPAELLDILKSRGLTKLYRHQAQALNALRAGRHVAVVTPTASGKTLTCLLPILETLLKKPDSKALFLYPIKALAQDQCGTMLEFLDALRPGQASAKSPQAAIYDGDTSAYRRTKMRENPPPFVLSNPDMLHMSFLPYHSSWGKFLSRLEYVVIDEAHTYRGVFGAHVAFAIRRLRRLCRFYGSSPKFIFLSATIANPAEFTERLLGEGVQVIADNGAPAGERLLALWNPQASPYRESTDLFGKLVKGGFKTIAFTKARKITELMSRWSLENSPELKNRIAAYRGGYMPEERRELESRLFSGELDGVISTSALELGIDVGGLDACVLVGFPGTMISARQRMGRVGREGQGSLVVMVGLNDALDQYFMNHPESFFERNTEHALIPVDNPVVVAAHYSCAAAELPLEDADARFFGPQYPDQARRLWREGILRQGVDGKYHAAERYPQRRVNIRSTGETYLIEARQGSSGPKVIGTLEVPRVFRDGHQGAIYLHQGAQWEVTELDQVQKRVRVREVEADYYTEPRGDDNVEILEVLKRVDLGHLEWCFGRVRASEQVTGYVTKHIGTQKVLSEYSLEMPLHSYETRASWWVLPADWRKEFALLGLDFAGSIHALEHAQIAILPVFAICDRWDLGGVSYWSQPQLDKPCVFVYDGHAGGAALAEQGFGVIRDWMEAVERLLTECPCEEGCPACVQSPKCGNGNKPLDKKGALELCRRLRARLASGASASKEPLEPVKPREAMIQSQVSIPTRVEAPAGATKLDPSLQDIVSFDLETQFLADEVGGWDNKAAMKISVAVTWSSREKKFRQYTEGQVQALIAQLKSADLVVGFNVINFDYAVLQAYTQEDLSKIPTLDMLVEVTRALGHRLKLDSLATATLNAPKSADGLMAVKWWREGNLTDLCQYCQKDVEITRDLWEFGRKYGYLLYEDRGKGLLRVPVSW